MPANILTITAGSSKLMNLFIGGFADSIKKDIAKDKDKDKIKLNTIFVDEKTYRIELNAPKEVAQRLYVENAKELRKVKNRMVLKAMRVKIINELKS